MTLLPAVERTAPQLPSDPSGSRALGRLVALLPAHDEEDNIAAALASLRAQTTPPDEIVVVADNCTDDTPRIAVRAGTGVFFPRDNAHKKAGALNQVLEELLPQLQPHDLVLVMDADCILDPGFLATARGYLRQQRYGGIGGVFRGGPGGGLVGALQRNEYARYARDVRRLHGRALVLTGTASVFPVAVLRQVRSSRRSGVLPDASGAGLVYDTEVLTEDNELSLALLTLGYQILAPYECTLETEVMTTWGDLGDQRLRWKRGALENLVTYGWTTVTRRYWGRQALALVGLLATTLYLGTIVVGIVVGLTVHAFWIAVTGLFALERVVTVRARGWRQMLLAATLLIELPFDAFLQLVQARAFTDAALNKERKW